MTSKPADGMLDFVLSKSANSAIPWYLLTSYLYYQRDVSLLSDARYDLLCNQLHSTFDELTHMHKHLIDKDSLKAGTGFQISEYPLMVIGAACHLAKIPFPSDALAPKAEPPKIRFTIKKAPIKLSFGRKP